MALAAVERVIDFYAAQGNADEAANWRKRRDEAFPPKQGDKEKVSGPPGEVTVVCERT